MKILVADDDAASRRLLEATLNRWGYEVECACDGNEALDVMQSPHPPQAAILDWMMPGLDGVDVCKRLRQQPTAHPAYLILLTVKGQKEDVVEGLEAGADDYITKPFDPSELRAHIRVGERVLKLQHDLAVRVEELEKALDHIKTLKGLLPICSYCKRIRDDHDYWQQVESYITQHSDAQFSHGICPECYEKYVKPQLKQMDAGKPKPDAG